MLQALSYCALQSLGDMPVPLTVEQHFHAAEALGIDSNDSPDWIGTTLLRNGSVWRQQCNATSSSGPKR